MTLPAFTNNGPNVVEVGPDASTYGTDPNGNTTVFQSFMLDLATGPVLTLSAAGGNLTITWDASDSFQHLYSTSDLLVPFTRESNVTITTANGISSVTVPIGNANEYFEVGH
jgi:hypothetical protein